MHFVMQKLFSLLILVSSGLSSPFQQAHLRFSSALSSPLRLPCHSDVGIISENDRINDVEYGYQGPGVYHITSQADLFNLVPGTSGFSDEVPVAVWCVFQTWHDHVHVTILMR